MEDYITGNKFIELTNEINQKYNSDFKQILFTNTIGYINAFNIAINNPQKKYILITHCSDNAIKKDDYLRKPKNIKLWFTQNCEYKNENLIPLPIGLQNEYGYNGGPGALIDYFKENVETWKKREKILNVIYCGWGEWVNPVRLKTPILLALEKNDVKYIWQDNLEKKEYWNKVSYYKFILSPPGNYRGGAEYADTHKNWESLYMGMIPIVLKAPLYDEFNDLPIIQVKDYSEITNDLLNFYLNKEYNYEKLYMTYWKKRIIEDYNNL